MAAELSLQDKLLKLVSENSDFSIHEEWDEGYKPNGKWSAEVEWIPEGLTMRRFLEARDQSSKIEAIEKLYELRFVTLNLGNAVDE